MDGSGLNEYHNRDDDDPNYDELCSFDVVNNEFNFLYKPLNEPYYLENHFSVPTGYTNAMKNALENIEDDTLIDIAFADYPVAKRVSQYCVAFAKSLRSMYIHYQTLITLPNPRLVQECLTWLHEERIDKTLGKSTPKLAHLVGHIQMFKIAIDNEVDDQQQYTQSSRLCIALLDECDTYLISVMELREAIWEFTQASNLPDYIVHAVKEIQKIAKER